MIGKESITELLPKILKEKKDHKLWHNKYNYRVRQSKKQTDISLNRSEAGISVREVVRPLDDRNMKRLLKKTRKTAEKLIKHFWKCTNLIAFISYVAQFTKFPIGRIFTLLGFQQMPAAILYDHFKNVLFIQDYLFEGWSNQHKTEFMRNL